VKGAKIHPCKKHRNGENENFVDGITSVFGDFARTATGRIAKDKPNSWFWAEFEARKRHFPGL
jgi:hypothetical protein